MQGALDEAIDAISASPTLLIACDYDGTLAPLVDNPDRAVPMRESIIALRSLAALADTHVAVISGRAVRDLAVLSRLPHEIHLVGSHGSEFEAGFVDGLNDSTRKVLDELTNELVRLASETPQARLEYKPAALAFHYRLVDPALVPELTTAITNAAERHPGVTVRNGKSVIELAVVDTDKGDALKRLRNSVGADAVLFIGDDVTDEDAFTGLTGPDVGVKVGRGDTAAGYRIDDPDAVAQLLATVFERRRTWLAGDAAPPIERHSLLSDQRTLALLTPDARVTWLCHPRADSPAVFAELLGGPSAGSFAVHPEPYQPPLEQRYVGDSLVVETRWADPRATDYLDVSQGRVYEPAGCTDLVRVLEGRGPVTINFAPRLDFGRAQTELELAEDGLTVSGAAEPIHVRSPGVGWTIVDEGMHQRAIAHLDLRAGQPVVLEVLLGGDPARRHSSDERERRRATIDYWSNWAAGLRLPSVAPEMVRRSALTLKALCHQPTGSILAAATTSLPECIGGVRNWDYRYCWPRDAALTAAALLSVGSSYEALAFLDWLAVRVQHASAPENLRPLYPLVGDEFTPEAVIPTLNGYLGSRPVRIGNMAEHQVQLDMFAPIVDLVRKLGEANVPIGERHWELVAALCEAVCHRWAEPDHGIWEERRQRRHHVHSKVMCWSVLNDGIAIAQSLGRKPPRHWEETKVTIHDDVTENGWNKRIDAFSSAYGDDDVNAAILQMSLVGFLPGDDPRIRDTVEAVERTLRSGEMVYRYQHDDGLPGEEGGFLLCSAWLIEVLVEVGRVDDARTLFGRFLDLAGPTGLLAEEYDPRRERALGNFPQAYSHLGLINAAVALGRLNKDGADA